MEQRKALLLIAIALVIYGVYHAFYAITMLLAPASPLLLLAFALQAALAILAAVGVWRQQPWAAGALLLLGASIAATALVEALRLRHHRLVVCTADRDRGNRERGATRHLRQALGVAAADPNRR